MTVLQNVAHWVAAVETRSVTTLEEPPGCIDTPSKASPASIVRFAMLESYDNVREHRLPPELRDQNPSDIWRQIDGAWTQGDVAV